jgi:hypothetical protein
MNGWDILILAVILALIGLAVFLKIRKKKKGSPCCGDCCCEGGCPDIKKKDHGEP